MEAELCVQNHLVSKQHGWSPCKSVLWACSDGNGARGPQGAWPDNLEASVQFANNVKETCDHWNKIRQDFKGIQDYWESVQP